MLQKKVLSRIVGAKPNTAIDHYQQTRRNTRFLHRAVSIKHIQLESQPRIFCDKAEAAAADYDGHDNNR